MIVLRLVLLLVGLAASVFPHSMSMSSGDLTLDGDEAVLSIYVPEYEAQEVATKTDLLDAFEVTVGAAELEAAGRECSLNEQEATYECTARYLLPEEMSSLDVECSLPDVVSPNHVHVLRAVSPDGNEQRVFDYATRRHSFRFQPAGPFERFAREFSAGAVRMLLGPAQLLFLFALSVAARDRSELVRMTGGFLFALVAAALAVSTIDWRPPPGFVDSAGALTIAYLAVETLVLPEAPGRWLVAGAMGVFHGLFFGLFLQQAPMQPAWVLGGAAAASVFVIGLLTAWILRLLKGQRIAVFRKASSWMLLLIGLGWFAIRIMS